MTARQSVDALSYTAEQVQDLRRRLRQAENQRDAALADLEAARADAARLRAIAERWVALVGDVSDGRLWPITGGLVNATRAALAVQS